MLSLGSEMSLQRQRVCVLTSLAVFAAATACGSGSQLRDSSGGDSKYRTEEQSAAANDSGSLTAAAAYGLGLRTTNSQELCEALRLGVDGSTFGRTVSQGRTSDYKPGLEDNQIYIKCEIATEDMEVESDPSGGGLYQRGVASLQISAPLLVDDNPSSRPVEATPGCQGSDRRFLNTASASYWCPAPPEDTAMGKTTMFFTDMVMTLEMQAPLVMTSGFTQPVFEAARDAILAKLSNS